LWKRWWTFGRHTEKKELSVAEGILNS
jgi:hypothetical protein